jgi:hypothetical protein
MPVTTFRATPRISDVPDRLPRQAEPFDCPAACVAGFDRADGGYQAKTP